MARSAVLESPAMAKAQKTVMIPDGLYKLINNQERFHGTTFTRQAVAAFFAYFFDDVSGPDPVWMQAVIALENGEISISEVPEWCVNKKLARNATHLEMCDQQLGDQPDNAWLKVWREYLTWQGDKLRLDLQSWKSIRESESDTIGALIARYNAQAQRTPIMTAQLPALPPELNKMLDILQPPKRGKKK